jgi:hypothetical protein
MGIWQIHLTPGLSIGANRTVVTAGDGENPFPRNARDRMADRDHPEPASPGRLAIVLHPRL